MKAGIRLSDYGGRSRLRAGSKDLSHHTLMVLLLTTATSNMSNQDFLYVNYGEYRAVPSLLGVLSADSMVGKGEQRDFSSQRKSSVTFTQQFNIAIFIK